LSGHPRPATRHAAAASTLARWCLVAGVGLGIATGAVAAERAELQDLRDRLERLRREVAESETDRKEVADQLRDSERVISEATRALRALEAQGRTARDELRAAEVRRRAIESEMSSRAKTLERLLYARYVHGDNDALRLTLSGNDAHQTARDLHYLTHVSKALAEVVEALRSRAGELARLAQVARDKGVEIARLETASREERAKLERERREWQQVFSRLSGQIRQQRREIETVQANERRLTELVERLARAMREREQREQRAREQRDRERERERERQAAAVPAPPAPGGPPVNRNEKVPEAGDLREFRGVFSGLRGRLRLPVRGDVATRFGARVDGGTSSKGLFIRAAEGDEVRAVAPGRVVYADWMRGFGNLIIVDHGDAYLTIYGNNESLLRKAGDAVKAGDPVATVGRTGGNDSAGLYFELRHQGRAVDPLSWVSLK